MTRIIFSSEYTELQHWSEPDVETVVDAEFTMDETTIEISNESPMDERLQQMVEQAHQRGLHEGIAQGREEMAQEANAREQSQTMEVISKLEQLMEQLTAGLKEQNSELEQQIISLVKKMVTRLYRHEIEINPQQIQPIVQEALNLLPSFAKKITVQISAQDAQWISERNLPQLQKVMGAIVVNENLQPGDCRVVSDLTEIDATLDARLDTLCQQLVTGESK